MSAEEDRVSVKHSFRLSKDAAIVNLQLEQLTIDPSNFQAGRIWINRTTGEIKYRFRNLENQLETHTINKYFIDVERIQTLVDRHENAATLLDNRADDLTILLGEINDQVAQIRADKEILIEVRRVILEQKDIINANLDSSNEIKNTIVGLLNSVNLQAASVDGKHTAVVAMHQTVADLASVVASMNDNVNAKSDLVDGKYQSVVAKEANVVTKADLIATTLTTINGLADTINSQALDITTKHDSVVAYHQQTSDIYGDAVNVKGEIETLESSVTTKANAVATQHGEVGEWHGQVIAAKSSTEAARDTAVSAAATALSSRDIVVAKETIVSTKHSDVVQAASDVEDVSITVGEMRDAVVNTKGQIDLSLADLNNKVTGVTTRHNDIVVKHQEILDVDTYVKSVEAMYTMDQVVRTTGDEDIAGHKTFTDNISVADRIIIEGKHSISANDGSGNFNIKVGLSPDALYKVTEDGYSAWVNYNQELGSWSFKSSTTSGEVGDTATLTNTMVLDKDGNVTFKGDVTGDNFKGSADEAKNSDKLGNSSPSQNAVANSIVKRTSDGDVVSRLLRSSYRDETSIAAGSGIAFRVSNTTNDYIRFISDKAVIREHLDVPAKAHTHTDINALIASLTTGLLGTVKTTGNQVIEGTKEFSADIEGTITNSNKLANLEGTVSDTGNSVAVRDSVGDIQTRLFRSTKPSYVSMPSTASLMFRNDDASDNFIRAVSDPASVRSWLGVLAVSETNYVQLSTTTNNALGSASWIANITSESNIDHVWYDDGSNQFNFVADQAFKTTANAAVAAGVFREGGTLLGDKYLGKTSKAANSTLFNGLATDKFVRTDINTIISAELRVNEGINTKLISSINGEELVLNAGEAANYMPTQTAEYVYLNAERGVVVTSSDMAHPNFETGYTLKETKINGEQITVDGNIVYHQGNLNVSSFISTSGDQSASGVKTFTTKVVSPRFEGNADSATTASKLGGLAGTTNHTSNTIAVRDGNADISARLFRSSYSNEATIADGSAVVFRRSSTDRYMRFCSDPAEIRRAFGLAASSTVSALQTTVNDTVRKSSNSTITADITMNGKLFFENGNHSITYNDGSGNFNIKVGTSADATHTVTETGYGSHWLFDQATGRWIFNTSTASKATGGTHVWNTNASLYADGTLDVRTKVVSPRFEGTADNASKLGNLTGYTTATASTVALRDTAGDVHARLFRSGYSSYTSLSDSAGLVFRNNTTSDNYLKVCTSKSAIRDWMDVNAKSEVMHLTGNEIVAGDKTFTGQIITHEITNRTGQQIVINIGESRGKGGVQTAESLYVNAEDGIKIVTPDSAHGNWAAGYTAVIAHITGHGMTINGNTVWHSGNDGRFLRSDVADVAYGKLLLRGDGGISTSSAIALGIGDSDTGIRWNSDGNIDLMANSQAVANITNSGFNVLKTLTQNGNTVWHSGNDGSGSALSAGNLAGYNLNFGNTENTVAGRNGNGDIYARLFRSTYQNESNISDTAAMAFRISQSDNYIRFITDKAKIRNFIGSPSAANGYVTNMTMGSYFSFADYDDGNTNTGLRCYVRDGILYFNKDTSGSHTPQIYINGGKVWHSGNDGAGSGLNADLLQGNSISSNAVTNTVALRTSSGDLNTRLVRSSYSNQSGISSSGGLVFRNNTTTDNYLKTCTSKSSVRSWMEVPSMSEYNALLARVEALEAASASSGSSEMFDAAMFGGS